MVQLTAYPISAERAAFWHRATGADGLPILPSISDSNKYTIDTARLSAFAFAALASAVARREGLTVADAKRALLLPSISADSVVVAPAHVERRRVAGDAVAVGWAVAY